MSSGRSRSAGFEWGKRSGGNRGRCGRRARRRVAKDPRWWRRRLGRPRAACDCRRARSNLALKHAKKFRLKFEGKVADFVKEEGAAIGEFEAANFLTDGAGEGAALVAEELGFEQTARNGGAINFNEGAIAARTEIMDGAGEELLAGGRFRRGGDGSAGGSGELHLSQGPLERGTLADDFLKIEFTANFFLEVELLSASLFFRASISLKARAFSTAIAICAATCCRSSTSCGEKASSRRLAT